MLHGSCTATWGRSLPALGLLQGPAASFKSGCLILPAEQGLCQQELAFLLKAVELPRI